jgi:hypothetical protein
MRHVPMRKTKGVGIEQGSHPQEPNISGKKEAASSANVKPWIGKTQPVVRIRGDDGKVYCFPFQAWSAVFAEGRQSLAVSCCHGTFTITGPGTEALVEALCGQRATQIRTDNVHITSVTLTTESEASAEAATKSVQRELEGEPD